MVTFEELSDANAQVVNSLFKHIQKEVIVRGYMPDINTYGDSEAEAIRYNQDVLTIQADKGFDVKVFNQSSARRKAEKKSTRIVMYVSRIYDGEIAAPIHAIIANDKTVGGNFKSGFLPTKASSLVIAIHLISDTDRRFYALKSIIGVVLAQRAYVTYWNSDTDLFYPDRFFLAEQTSYNDLNDALEGVFEKVFYYTVPDIYQSDMQTITEISPIKQIKIQTTLETDFIDVQSEP